jgi:hypothetical protein
LLWLALNPGIHKLTLTGRGVQLFPGHVPV